MMEASVTWVSAQPREHPLDDFRAIFEEHGVRLFRLAFRITGHRQDAEDVVQETFVRAHRNRARFDTRSELGSWLHRIATNVAIDVLRKRRRQRTHAQDSLDAHVDLSIAEPDPEHRARGREIERMIRQALGLLSEKEKTAFVLRHLEGLSIEEIGRVTGTGTNTTKNLIFRAVRKIRRELAPHVEVRE